MDQITLKNFRCFREEQIARLAPLTFLVGENSTGKTSFLAMIRALFDVAYWNAAPDFKEDPYDLGSFDEIAHYRGGRGGRADTFEAGFSLFPRTARGKRRRAGTSDQLCHVEVTFERRGTVPVPVRKRLSRGEVWVENRLEGQSWQTSFGTPRGAWGFSDTFPGRLGGDYSMLPSFFSLSPRGLGLGIFGEPESGAGPIAPQAQEPPTDQDRELIQQLADAYYEPGLGYRPYASAPVRSKPRRTYDPSRPTPDPEGDYVPMYLASIYFQEPRKWEELKSALENFGRAAGLFDEISIRPLGRRASEPFQLQVRKFAGRLKGPERSLIDVGYGISQVLPVITELLRQGPPSMFLLQQPEVHLHPSAQAALGSLFCEVASQDRRLIVETHSDYLLDRVRMDIRDSKTSLKPADVSILFFERGALDVHIHPLQVDQEGNISDPPQSYRRFFMEETARILRL